MRQLRLFLDCDGLIRCGGRIHNALLSESARFPYLLPPNHPLTALIVNDTQRKQVYSGVNAKVAALRQSLQAPRSCSLTQATSLRGSTLCCHRSGFYRTTVCAIREWKDKMLHMPVFLRRNKSSTLESPFWLNREKLPSSIPSLHKPQISSLPYVVGQRFHLLVCGRVTRKTLPVTFTFLGRQGVEWQFIPKRAPSYGVFWECLIGLSKRAIKKTLGRPFITLEAILNDNPITYVSGDVGDEEA